MRLLWVENHAAFARVAGQQFLAAHDLTVVPSLAAAKAALASRTFDAVLLDYDLDDGKGDELMGLIGRLPLRLAVVATSSHEAGNAALLAAGARATCPKGQFARIDAALRAVVAEQGNEGHGGAR